MGNQICTNPKGTMELKTNEKSTEKLTESQLKQQQPQPRDKGITIDDYNNRGMTIQDMYDDEFSEEGDSHPNIRSQKNQNHYVHTRKQLLKSITELELNKQAKISSNDFIQAQPIITEILDIKQELNELSEDEIINVQNIDDVEDYFAIHQSQRQSLLKQMFHLKKDLQGMIDRGDVKGQQLIAEETLSLKEQIQEITQKEIQNAIEEGQQSQTSETGIDNF